ncbi:MAG: hypothetical protein ACM3ZB_12900 [bacterium]|jgi:translation initiation factor 2B subunit (eIF-2B alpha/beta/delta family)
MQDRVASLIETIARDRSAGAAELAVRAAEALALAAPEELPEAAAAVMRAQPAMAAVYNAARAALAGELEAFTARLRASADIIARRIEPIVRGKTVLTHSYSSTVVQALRRAGPVRVICTESQPGGEGRETAARLGGEVIPDMAAYSALEHVDAVVVGADAVTPEYVVNKTGTAMVALAARERGVPAYVLCGSEKFVPAEWKPELGALFELAPRALFTSVIDDVE